MRQLTILLNQPLEFVRRDNEVLDGVGTIRLLARAGNWYFVLYVVPQARHQPEANSTLANPRTVVGVAEGQQQLTRKHWMQHQGTYVASSSLLETRHTGK